MSILCTTITRTPHLYNYKLQLQRTYSPGYYSHYNYNYSYNYIRTYEHG